MVGERALVMEPAPGEVEVLAPAIEVEDGVPEDFVLVLTVCVLPLNIDSSSLTSVGCEGLKISFGRLSGKPLVASR